VAAAAHSFPRPRIRADVHKTNERLLEGGAAIIEGDSELVLRALPEDLCQCVVTSPPYWFVRDYGIGGQIGLERSLDDYISALVDVFRLVRRVLRTDGVLWLNIGDGYTSGGRASRAPDRKNAHRAMGDRPPTPADLKPKDLIGVPWRLAFALQQPWLHCRTCKETNHASLWGRMPGGGNLICPACCRTGNQEVAEPGWYLRSEIIWERPNCQPESVRDRVTRAHEHLFMLTKSERYNYDNHGLRGPNGRNLRTVWRINTEPGEHGHVAIFPQALAAPCLALTTKPGDLVLDPFLGSGTTAVVAKRMGRRYLGIELDPEAIAAAQVRLADVGDDLDHAAQLGELVARTGLVRLP